jgi:hypothetical protein
LVFTIASKDDTEEESKLSNTRTTHSNEKLDSRAPEGRTVEVYDSSIFDLNTIISVSSDDEDDEDEMVLEETYPNW